ncbi:isochorismatase family protein [Curtobacterium sp. ISL-83]|uniref:isochorismatase family protein n=1 Tax=Curtobacterium sp. ISL-83 TaxID=2819145 RepID=UPI001BEA755A|nr:isochorismatase family protein [Curtobacterium sp. ISL-83]MBT2504272.1 isochorismatase family protein [Curtobacterium sp. ISL-83]
MPITTIDPTAALILVDLQKGILGAPTTPVPIDTVLANARDLAAAFRRSGHQVILVNVAGGAPGRTDEHQKRAASGAPTAARPEGWMELADEIDAQPSDHRITKTTWGAFSGTSLDEHLKEQGVTQVILGGVATSVGVESTARNAHELGYHAVLATDAMSDRDSEAHQNSTSRIFPRLGETATTAEILNLLV